MSNNNQVIIRIKKFIPIFSPQIKRAKIEIKNIETNKIVGVIFPEIETKSTCNKMFVFFFMTLSSIKLTRYGVLQMRDSLQVDQ